MSQTSSGIPRQLANISNDFYHLNLQELLFIHVVLNGVNRERPCRRDERPAMKNPSPILLTTHHWGRFPPWTYLRKSMVNPRFKKRFSKLVCRLSYHSPEPDISPTPLNRNTDSVSLTASTRTVGSRPHRPGAPCHPSPPSSSTNHIRKTPSFVRCLQTRILPPIPWPPASDSAELCDAKNISLAVCQQQ